MVSGQAFPILLQNLSVSSRYHANCLQGSPLVSLVPVQNGKSATCFLEGSSHVCATILFWQWHQQSRGVCNCNGLCIQWTGICSDHGTLGPVPLPSVVCFWLTVFEMSFMTSWEICSCPQRNRNERSLRDYNWKDLHYIYITICIK